MLLQSSAVMAATSAAIAVHHVEVKTSASASTADATDCCWPHASHDGSCDHDVVALVADASCIHVVITVAANA